MTAKQVFFNGNRLDAKPLRVLDIGAGRGGFSRAFEARGHDVTTLDVDGRFRPDIRADIRAYHGEGGSFDVVLIAMPCTDFSKMSLPATWAYSWKHPRPEEPDISLVLAALRVKDEIGPKWWVMENVRGSVPYISRYCGPPVRHVGSRYLWGDFPIMDPPAEYGKWRMPPSGDRTAKRAEIPHSLSLALCRAMEAEWDPSADGRPARSAREP